MFQWDTYLSLAKEMSDKEEEQFKRSAISRAYYSAFHQGRAYLKERGLSYTSRENVHSFVWDSFSKFPREARLISAKGDRLKLKRQKADYDNVINNVNNLTKAAIKEAEDINEAIKKLSK